MLTSRNVCYMRNQLYSLQLVSQIIHISRTQHTPPPTISRATNSRAPSAAEYIYLQEHVLLFLPLRIAVFIYISIPQTNFILRMPCQPSPILVLICLYQASKQKVIPKDKLVSSGISSEPSHFQRRLYELPQRMIRWKQGELSQVKSFNALYIHISRPTRPLKNNHS